MKPADNIVEKTPESAAEWYGFGVFLRMNGRFGEAINAFMEAADVAEKEISGCPDDVETIKALEEIRSKAFASVDLLKEINGFVNKDLMNP